MNNPEALRVAVVIGSNREGRLGATVAQWFLREIAGMDGLDVDTIDLAELDLHTRIGIDPPSTMRAVTPRVAAADAFIFVTPEYNHSFPASIKAFIDLHVEQWCAKAVGFISYGGVAGGLRSVEALRLVFASLNAMTVPNTVTFANAWDEFVDGVPKDPKRRAAAAESLLRQVKWWGHALRNARRHEPLCA
ncbi:NAD(P)H-dependent oxidoreductase [Mycobacterium fragae]|uniref:NADPH-dependent FMN reductase n=1 Tax=Mycobacterium fragae TaxID=1260918 RepID=A0A1X1V3G0_9MYCO|nr:NAD(P)H-dependent oxidoreductase [Mycobacterium fragae]MCV7399754.1 NAD(P)H-dependent oxidoreductase [Mycobacterium fragae]ORV63602.1 NADPH-dependent FMN reductase [Mycobacterium fragae]